MDWIDKELKQYEIKADIWVYIKKLEDIGWKEGDIRMMYEQWSIYKYSHNPAHLKFNNDCLDTYFKEKKDLKK